MVNVHVRLVAFLGVDGLVVITPGVDPALVTKNALLHGRRQAIASALGVNLGISTRAWISGRISSRKLSISNPLALRQHALGSITA